MIIEMDIAGCKAKVESLRVEIAELERGIAEIEETSYRISVSRGKLSEVRDDLLRNVERSYEAGASLRAMQSFREIMRGVITGSSYENVNQAIDSTGINILGKKEEFRRRIGQLKAQLAEYETHLSGLLVAESGV